MLWRQDKRIKEIPEGGGTAKGRTLQGFAFMTYEDQLLHPKWIEKRDHILERDWKICQVCMTSKDLQVHHKYYVKGRMAWEYPDNALITLCRKHHVEEHASKTIPVLEHGNALDDLFQRLKDNFEYLNKAIHAEKIH